MPMGVRFRERVRRRSDTICQDDERELAREGSAEARGLRWPGSRANVTCGVQRPDGECRSMSMITEYVRLRPHELTELRRLLVEEPDAAYEYASDIRMGDEDEEVSLRGMDTDKAWAGPQILLA